jgi:hypothetical protein
MNAYSKATGGFVVALFLAVALTGTPTFEVGIKAQCEDQVDNDSDGNLDARDGDCWIYPFDDGGGEYYTTTGSTGKAWSSSSYSMSLFEWRLSQNLLDPSLFQQGQIGSDHCFDTVAQEAEYTQIGIDSGGKDNSLSIYQSWHPLNC